MKAWLINALVPLLMVIPALVPPPADAASTLRCHNQLVQVGDRKFEVEKKCGEPMSKTYLGETVYDDGERRRTVLVEEWVYELRYGFYDILTFRGGRLIKLELKQK